MYRYNWYLPTAGFLLSHWGVLLLILPVEGRAENSAATVEEGRGFKPGHLEITEA